MARLGKRIHGDTVLILTDIQVSGYMLKFVANLFVNRSIRVRTDIKETGIRG